MAQFRGQNVAASRATEALMVLVASVVPGPRHLLRACRRAGRSHAAPRIMGSASEMTVCCLNASDLRYSMVIGTQPISARFPDDRGSSLAAIPGPQRNPNRWVHSTLGFTSTSRCA